MSNFVERTFGSLNTILNNSNFFSSSQDKLGSKSNFQSPWATEFSFLEKLKNSESKRDEEQQVNAFKLAAEKRLSQPNVSNAEIQSIVKQCMICERLGYVMPFIYVHTIKLAQKGNLQEKHTGYLAAAEFLNPQHEMVILLINTMQKDICSSNHVEVLLGLTSVCNLINCDSVHNVIHLVEDKLAHKSPLVRKLAVLTLNHCVGLVNSISSYRMALPKVEKALTDPDLDVVSAAVPTVYNIIQKLSGDYTYLLNGLIHLQDQILQRRIPNNLKYNDIPAPWLQINILKLLSYLSKDVQQTESIISILKKTLLQAEVKHYMAYAIIQEAIDTATCIEPNAELTQLVLSSIHKFLRSSNFNLKLIGMESLISVVKKMKPSIDASQQEIIMGCLKQPDETLQLKTLDLLYHLANSSNVEAICKRMVDFMVLRKDESSKKRLSLMVLELATKYKEKQVWYISVVNTILSESDHVLSPKDVNSIIAVIEKDDAMKETAKNVYMDMNRKKLNFTSSMIKLVAIVLSSPTEFQEILPNLIKEADESASLWLLVSLQQILLTSKEIPPSLNKTLSDLPKKFYSTAEVIHQLHCIIECKEENDDLKYNIEIDPSLTFLDDYVVKSLEEGASCYHPPSFRSTENNLGYEPCSDSASSSKVSLACNSQTSTFPLSPIHNEASSSISLQSYSSDADSKSGFTSDYNLAKGDQITIQSDNFEKDETMKKECLELFAGVS